MTNLNIPGRRYVFASILITMVTGSIAYLVLSLLIGSWAAREPGICNSLRSIARCSEHSFSAMC